MFFISKKKFQEQVKKETNQRVEARLLEESIFRQFVMLDERIRKLNERVSRMENQKLPCEQRIEPDLPY